MNDQKSVRAVVLSMTVLVAAVPAMAAVKYWETGSDGFWQTGENWTGDTSPVAGDKVQIQNAGTKTVTIDDSTPTENLTIAGLTIIGIDGGTNTLLLSGNTTPLTLTGDLFLRDSVNGAASRLTVDEGQIVTTNGVSYVGYQGDAKATISNGGIWNSAGKDVRVSQYGGNSMLEIDDGTMTVNNLTLSYSEGTGAVSLAGGELTAGNVTIGRAGLGTMTVSDGLLEAHIISVGGSFSSGTGVLTIDGGQVRLGNRLYVGFRTTGSVFLRGGTLTTTKGDGVFISGSPDVSAGAGGIANVDISGGAWTSSTFYVAWSGPGTVTVSGGSLMVLGNGRYLNVGSNGMVTITGGTVSVAEGQAVWVKNGGQLTLSQGGGTGGNQDYSVQRRRYDQSERRRVAVYTCGARHHHQRRPKRSRGDQCGSCLP